MTISVWRYSHLLLAISSGIFLLLASVTGVILAFEPIQQGLYPFQPRDISEISLAETIGKLQETYDEVLTLQVDPNGFLIADIVTNDGDSQRIYAHPLTGEKLGTPKPQHPVYQFTTNLHRSLFLKGIGRFFVGLVSFLLCLIAVTGFLLIVKRQGGILRLFSRVQKDYFELRYHVILGRWFLLPLLIIAATGVYLSAEKFSLLPAQGVSHPLVEPDPTVEYSAKPPALEIFKGIPLHRVRSVVFPFSEMPEDYFEISLQRRELRVHQYTGEILSEQPYPFTAIAGRWSLFLHTGRGSVIWSVVLLLAGMSLLFFLYSGFVMWQRRIRNSRAQKGNSSKDESTHIILVGSETGSTYRFARALENALLLSGTKVFVGQLNEYSSYRKATHIFFLTSTYGEGEAPGNAGRFREVFPTVTPCGPVKYSVVGFGSLLYPDYCKFAVQVEGLLAAHPRFTPVLPLCKINEQSAGAFKAWAKDWSAATGMNLRIEIPGRKDGFKPRTFDVLEKSAQNNEGTFLMRLRPVKRIKFQSGDLLEYRPEDGISRWYSIGRIKGDMVLSIKKHEHGISSTFLSELQQGQQFGAAVKRNPEFHFPGKTKEIICIANGTGIAPFLGMFDENSSRIPIHLYWGGRTKASFEIYRGLSDEALKNGKLSGIHFAFSREAGQEMYVQDLVDQNKEAIVNKINCGATVMICGSLCMQNSVLNILSRALEGLLERPLSDFQSNGQIRMDCY